MSKRAGEGESLKLRGAEKKDLKTEPVRPIKTTSEASQTRGQRNWRLIGQVRLGGNRGTEGAGRYCICIFFTEALLMTMLVVLCAPIL